MDIEPEKMAELMEQLRAIHESDLDIGEKERRYNQVLRDMGVPESEIVGSSQMATFTEAVMAVGEAQCLIAGARALAETVGAEPDDIMSMMSSTHLRGDTQHNDFETSLRYKRMQVKSNTDGRTWESDEELDSWCHERFHEAKRLAEAFERVSIFGTSRGHDCHICGSCGRVIAATLIISEGWAQKEF